MVWYRMVRYGTVLCTVWYGAVQSGTVRYGAVRYGTVRYSTAHHVVRRSLFSDIFIPAKSRNIFHPRNNVCGANILSPLSHVGNCIQLRCCGHHHRYFIFTARLVFQPSRAARKAPKSTQVRLMGQSAQIQHHGSMPVQTMQASAHNPVRHT